ncbi:MAG: hypothetical protein EAZ40_12285 [Rhodobacterales bacterium]|nr:MAG: hypothetical protein EAZ40_12285 [Rhodobacterales bacterium]
MAKSDVAVRVIGGGAALLAGSAGLAQAQDVAGWYGGVGVGAKAGDFLAFGNDEYSFDGGPGGSLFAGYNFVSGNLVYGAELGLNGKAKSDDPDAIYAGSISNLIDLKGRLGTVVGNTLFYGSLGYTVGDMEVEFDGESGGDVSGINFGAGFETSVTDNIFIGGDITKRNLDGGGTLYGGPAENYMDDIDLTTVSIRLGFRF